MFTKSSKQATRTVYRNLTFETLQERVLLSAAQPQVDWEIGSEAGCFSTGFCGSAGIQGNSSASDAPAIGLSQAGSIGGSYATLGDVFGNGIASSWWAGSFGSSSGAFPSVSPTLLPTLTSDSIPSSGSCSFGNNEVPTSSGTDWVLLPPSSNLQFSAPCSVLVGASNAGSVFDNSPAATLLTSTLNGAGPYDV
ncbi:MAG: hypothetical protein ACRC46_09045, partial [Thermoguttaceae bacterium]